MSRKAVNTFANLVTNAWIGGAEQQSPASTFTVLHKFSGIELAKVGFTDQLLLEKAVESSVSAFDVCSRMSAGDRAGLLRRIRNSVEKERSFFEQLIVAESGKPIAFAMNELDRCLLTIEAGERECMAFKGEMVPADMGKGIGKFAFTQWFPSGPVLGFTPFNFPLNLALHKLVPAIAAGCSILLKPSPHSPLSLLQIARLISDAGAPPGMVNVLCCNNDLANTLVRDERFSTFSFTGSALVGWALRTASAARKVILELGGNAPVIIDENADLIQAARHCVLSAFAYAGQVCISSQRIICHQTVSDVFLQLLIEETKKIKSGDPSDKEVINGPMIDLQSIEHLKKRIKEALLKGARLEEGGQTHEDLPHVFEPTILSNVPSDIALMQEEAFAPVLLFEVAQDFSHALQLANSGKYGLQCGVFTQNLEHMKIAFKMLKFGGIIINNTPNFRLDHMPYGGIRQSGIGREGIRYAMEEMSESKLIVF